MASVIKMSQKHLLALAMMALGQTAFAADYYVSPSGSDSALGTLASPFKSVQKAYALAGPGSTIYLRGGVYPLSQQILLTKSGTEAGPIRIFNYASEVPILDGAGMTTVWEPGFVLRIEGNFHHIKGLEVRNGSDGGVLLNKTASRNTLENLNVHHSGRVGQWGIGVAIRLSSAGNLVRNCDSHHNRSVSVPGNSDGFQAVSSGPGNYFYGNRSYMNGDDGYDFWNSAPVTLDSNWAYENGYDDSYRRIGDGNGFKLGGHNSGYSSGGSLVINNVAWKNPGNGFDENSASKPLLLYNNTAWSNANFNYAFWNLPNNFRNNLSYAGRIGASGDDGYNSWTLPVSVGAEDFVSLSDSIARGSRGPWGALPESGFLHLAAGSDLIGRGVYISLSDRVLGPDLGAYKYSSGTAPAPAPAPEPSPEPADVTAPTVQLTSPTQGSSYKNRTTVSISAAATDNVKVARVRFLVNGREVCSSYAAPFACNWKTPKKGASTVQIQAEAYDLSGNKGVSSIVTIYVKSLR